MAICPNIVKRIVPILAVVSTLCAIFSGVASIHRPSVIPIAKDAKGVVVTCKYPCNPRIVVPGYLSIGFLVVFSLIAFPFLFYRRVLWSRKTFVALVPILLASIGAVELISSMLHCNKTKAYVDLNPSSSIPSCFSIARPCLIGSTYTLVLSFVWNIAIKYFEEEDSSHNKFSSKVAPTSDVA